MERDLGLYVSPHVEVYESFDQQAGLIAALDNQDRHTLSTPIDDPRQMILDPQGRTKLGGLRFSVVAFRQLCRLLSPGLAGVVTDLAGLRRVPDDAEQARYSVAHALHIFNTVVQLRFRFSVEGMQMVRDTREGVIEGIVGRGYRRLSNLELYTRADEVLRTYRQPVEFFRAVTCGRYIVLCYRGIESLFDSGLGPRGADVYSEGFYYSNSEVGDGSVRATTALIREEGDTKALGTYSSHGGKVVHAGNGFNGRFEMLLNTVSARRPDAAFLQNQVARLNQAPLGFTTNDDHNESRFIALTQYLQSKQLTRGLSRKVLRNVLVQGSFDDQPFGEINHVRRDVWAARSAYDLFNSMTRVARTMTVTIQESLEQMAYRLLVGRLAVPPQS